MDSALDNEEAYAELTARLREELDYEREAAQQRLYTIMLADQPNVHVPVPVDELTTKRLLTMTWLEGQPIMRRIEEGAPQEERDGYARALFAAWYKPLYRFGVIHGDPHLGNYQVRPADGGINLLDFGTIRVFPPSFVTGVITLYEAVRDNDNDKAAHGFEIWGFRNLSRETMLVLKTWADFLYEPLMQDRVRPIQETDDPLFGRRVARRSIAASSAPAACASRASSR
jgi:predicted unusual protein kinase regulating ubiquinone biosynthesis (AarF/ABC1/UbiB family)